MYLNIYNTNDTDSRKYTFILYFTPYSMIDGWLVSQISYEVVSKTMIRRENLEFG